MRRRVTRRLAGLQTMCNVLKFPKILLNVALRLRCGCVYFFNLLKTSTVPRVVWSSDGFYDHLWSSLVPATLRPINLRGSYIKYSACHMLAYCDTFPVTYLSLLMSRTGHTGVSIMDAYSHQRRL